jgi:hypothetical protein
MISFCHSRAEGWIAIQKIAYFLSVMPDPIPAKDGIFDRHPVLYGVENTLDSPSALLRAVSLSNRGSSLE